MEPGELSLLKEIYNVLYILRHADLVEEMEFVFGDKVKDAKHVYIYRSGKDREE